MKKILGLDLGVSSIGWALIKEEQEKPVEIIGMGVRIVPLDTDENQEFTQGNTITKNQERTKKRSTRRSYYRYVLRRKALTAELKKHQMFNEKLFGISKLELWGLRSKAVEQQISLEELGRVLYHLNQKRGYKSVKNEEKDNKEETNYVSEIKNRYDLLKNEGKTIGQKFYEELSKNYHYRIKQQVYPREAYIEEFNKIIKKQQEFYPEILTDEFINHLRDNIIYHQRNLKSQKGLVKTCEFEGFHVKNKEGKEIFTGPKVAHRSNPLFQTAKIWESINNIVIEDKRKNKYPITIEQKQAIFEYLDNNIRLSQSELFKILGIKDKSEWYGNKMLSKGIQGNTTKVAIKEALNNNELAKHLLQFEIKVKKVNQSDDSNTYLIDNDSGEITKEEGRLIVDNNIVNEPLYQIWHVIYSIRDINKCKYVLMKKWGLDEITAEKLAKIDFTKSSYGNKSIKALRKILPYLMKGYKYSDAASFAGYNHSKSLTKEEIIEKKLLDKIPILPKNVLRQPVVEKILNQMIHIINDIIDENRGWVTKEERDKGKFEIRIELARELKQSREERNETYKNLSRIEKENKEIERRLEELGVRATRKNIIKYRLFSEISENKINATCIYTGKMFSLTDALNGNEIDVEHIIPKSILFDDSQSNKTLTFSYINKEKGDRTAYDYMASKGEEELSKYIERVDQLFKNKIINKQKRDKLLMPANNIPKDFIERQIRESQYISRKSREILNQICKNVWVTGGGVTAYLRRIWGWDDILMHLQLKRIKELIPDPVGEKITEIVEWETEDGQIHHKEVIRNWNKRNDHRHHAIDALVIACTKQGYIQRINTLSAKTTRDEIFKEVSQRNTDFRESLSLLDKYFITQKPFTSSQVEEKVNKVIISIKPGKKVATYGKQFIRKNDKRIIVQDHIIVPRGALSEESIYGKIKILDQKKPVKYLFENTHLIFKPYIKELVEQRLSEYNGDAKKALASLKNNPIYLDNKNRKVPLEYASCFKEEYVIKYPIESITEKDIEYIVDKKVREIISQRLKQYSGNTKEAFKEPVYLNNEKKIPIKTVRMFTKLSAVEVLKYDENGKPIAYVKTGNNHHIAIYQDEDGKKIPHLCTFWHAVDRKKYGIPVIIDNPKSVWDKILSSKENYPQPFLIKLPDQNWKFIQSFQQNEIFYISPDNKDDINIDNIEPFNLYRLQKMSMIGGKQINLWFRQIFETETNDSKNYSLIKKFYNIQSISAIETLNPIKIKVNRLGEIEAIDLK
ncbi:CRISPR-associated endonuclease Csn1 [Thermoflavifilum aggregans]|uniref:CRISPR-associated endonuclease Cas9 n=1 Tax=Thermoflavifilum aggregans TaxID=454188 RepID=A0A2M9CY37_9BACT|nr:type II CRISPR RNA-guided endonuclease Cas9 [Thermoflavifilum aggregans]PJJ76797.1 CRISPR-associated endonuclease Csn1 [Thermoflavifilum aggregans]